jgi:hypothetical protein
MLGIYYSFWWEPNGYMYHNHLCMRIWDGKVSDHRVILSTVSRSWFTSTKILVWDGLYGIRHSDSKEHCNTWAASTQVMIVLHEMHYIDSICLSFTFLESFIIDSARIHMRVFSELDLPPSSLYIVKWYFTSLDPIGSWLISNFSSHNWELEALHVVLVPYAESWFKHCIAARSLVLGILGRMAKLHRGRYRILHPNQYLSTIPRLWATPQFTCSVGCWHVVSWGWRTHLDQIPVR